MNLHVRAVRPERAERQTDAQLLRTIHSIRTELPQTDRVAMKTRDDLSARVSFERDIR